MVMMAGIAIGAWAAAGLLGQPGEGRATVVLGVALMLYAALGLANVRFTVPGDAERVLGPIIGVASGALTSITGVFVLPGVPYLQALGLPKDDLVQALGLFFTVSTLALAAVLVQDSAFDLSIGGASVLALAAALVGMVLGQRLRPMISEAIFRRCFFAGMLALGAHLASRALV
ncbi:sulfite exporter TauE/SafE family protein [Micromonospora sp. STR1s_5]|nr:sulfite exporter TauE/SafE family protein [Micromonospora sp. STR1s_5]